MARKIERKESHVTAVQTYVDPASVAQMLRAFGVEGALLMRRKLGAWYSEFLAAATPHPAVGMSQMAGRTLLSR